MNGISELAISRSLTFFARPGRVTMQIESRMSVVTFWTFAYCSPPLLRNRYGFAQSYRILEILNERVDWLDSLWAGVKFSS